MAGDLSGILSRPFVRAIIENTPAAYIIMDSQFNILFINEFFLKLRKFRRNEIMGRKCYELSNGGMHCHECAVATAIGTGRCHMISRKDTLPDGTVRYVDDYAVPLITDEGGKVKFVLEIMLDRTAEMLERERRDQVFAGMVRIMSGLLDAKDRYTAKHSRRVHDISIQLARTLGLGERALFEISVAASLHDLGKLRVPGAIINKPGRLTDDEFAVIRNHSITSHDMLNGLSGFENVKDIVRHHHERFDGRGYPERLRGEALPLGARIVAVADSYDAMTSTRSYRAALSHEYAMDEIRRNAGTQFDPEIVEAFTRMPWEDLSDDLQSALTPGGKRVSRVLPQTESAARTKPHAALGEAIPEDPSPKDQIPENQIPENQIIERVFEHAPVGYVVMALDHTVLFANQYFLTYMGLTERQVVGGKCYDFSRHSAPCRMCPVARAMASGRMEYELTEMDTPLGKRAFDSYAMPCPTGHGEPVIVQIVMDRTQEITLEKRRELDFGVLFGTLSALIDENCARDPLLEQQLRVARAQLEDLLQFTKNEL